MTSFLRILLLIALATTNCRTVHAGTVSNETWRRWLDHINAAGNARDAKDYRKAIEESKASLVLAEQLGDDFYIRASIEDLAIAHQDNRDFLNAEIQFKRLADIEAGSTSLYHALSSLAYLYEEQKKFDLAESTYRQAIRPLKKILLVVARICLCRTG